MNIAAMRRAAAVVLVSMLGMGTAHAVYRCGNVYQDRPCDDKGPQPHLTPGMKAAPAAPATPSAPAPAASPFAASCSRVGEQAQKVAWKREGGATQEQQMADMPANVPRSVMSTVIASVYAKRGSAPEIRAAVEAECIAERQADADAAAAAKLLLQAQQRGGASAAPATAAASAPAEAAPKAVPVGTGPSPSCPGWRSQLDSINADFRRGGSAVEMERLQNRRRDVEQQMRGGRC